ncbi:MAG: tRNA (N6-isopentenyl adenosine(37)-C2)-methylthiotransferase MiaB [Acidobacteria bacterium]|nr:MAG: tRNA (N6-isopentenyl adenosine(37)-C2)-methylthiotransferase MiaB [Acidobacteriota bacterium]
MSRTFYIETFGCQMNELDSEKIAGSLLHEGMEPVSDPAKADIIILNTCSIREKAVQKVYARLGEVKRHKTRRGGDLVVGVVGCMAQLEGEKILERAPFVNIIAGPQKGHVMPELVARALETRRPAIDLRMDDDPEPLETRHVLRVSAWRAGVTISEGCNRHCAFCVVPLTRGPQKDRPSSNIISEAARLVDQGYLEIVLLGQTVNSYRDPSPPGLRFAGLLRKLAEIPGLKRVRFTSPHPNDFSDDLLDVMVSCSQVCNQIHLPVQSGSTRVLLAMRRGYTRERYLETIRKIQSATRAIAISTDIIVGFPGETETDFEDTLRLLDEVQYDSVFSFKYSPRPNTAALNLPGEVPEEEKGKRLRRLQEHQNLIQYNKNAAYVAQVLEVLVEDRARANFSLAGRAANNKVVNFNGPESLIGKFAEIQITGFSANSLRGVRVQ